MLPPAARGDVSLTNWSSKKMLPDLLPSQDSSKEKRWFPVQTWVTLIFWKMPWNSIALWERTFCKGTVTQQTWVLWGGERKYRSRAMKTADGEKGVWGWRKAKNGKAISHYYLELTQEVNKATVFLPYFRNYSTT